MQIAEADVRGWDGVVLDGGRLRLGLVPRLGGRILSLALDGEELLFADSARAGERPDLGDGPDLRARKRAFGFPLWGGDKTWIAPQAAWWEATPPLVLDSGPYDLEHEVSDAGEAIVMTSPTCDETGLVVERRVSFGDAPGTVRLAETLVNAGGTPVERGLWNVTQLLRPLDVFLPAARETIRAYPQEGDSVALRDALLTERNGWTCVPCREAAHFKFGGVVAPPVIVALGARASATVAHVRRFESPPEARYAHDASAEVYNSPTHPYLEIEAHAPLVPLVPSRRHTHRSDWWFGWLEGEPTPDLALERSGLARDLAP